MARILIIDDEPGIRTTLASILEDEGHRATLAESGEEGIAQFAREEFDLVLLDLWLPGIDGLAVLERLQTAAAGTPIIMISGHGNIENAVRATRLGAYFQRPPAPRAGTRPAPASGPRGNSHRRERGHAAARAAGSQRSLLA
jgi:DNA-binding NtrC family response regulator